MNAGRHLALYLSASVRWYRMFYQPAVCYFLGEMLFESKSFTDIVFVCRVGSR